MTLGGYLPGSAKKAAGLDRPAAKTADIVGGMNQTLGSPEPSRLTISSMKALAAGEWVFSTLVMR